MANKKLFTVLRIAVTLALFVFGARLVDWNTVISLVQNMTWPYVLCAFTLMGIGLVFSMLRYHAIVNLVGADFPLRAGWRLYLAGHGFNQILPTGMGGDVLRMFILRNRMGLEHASQTVFLDRGLGLYHLFVQSFLLALVVLADGFMAPPLVMVFKISGVVLALSLLAIIVLTRPAVKEFYTKRLGRFSSFITMGIRALGCMPAHAYSALGQIAFNFSFCMLGWALVPAGIDATLAYITLVPSIFILMQVPVSLGGWGMREAAAVALLPMAGMSTDAAFANALLYGVLLLVSGLFGLVFWALAPKVPD